MDPVTLSLLASAGIGAAKAGIGAAQAAKGKRLSRGARPQKEISSSMNEYLSNAKAAAASSRLPGQDIIEQQIGGASASGIRAAQEGASSSAGLMAAIAGVKGNEQKALGDLGIAGAEMQAANKDKLQSALLKYGQAQDEQFDINQMQPFQDKAQAAQALKGAGLQNIMGGIDSVAGAASMGITNAAGTGNRLAAPGTPAVSSPLGSTNGTQKLGMANANNALGSQTNAQKYLTAKRKGFTGGYNDWLSQQSLGSGLNFSMM